MTPPLQSDLLRRRRAAAGMTLVEVLVALTILGTGVVILVSGAARALSVARRAQHYTNARHLLALVDLEQPVSSASELADAPESGEFEAPFELYHWTREAELFGPEQDRMYLVRTRILWSDRGSETEEQTVTLMRDTGVAASAGERDTDASATASGSTGVSSSGSRTGMGNTGGSVTSRAGGESQTRSGMRVKAPTRGSATGASGRRAPSGNMRPSNTGGARSDAPANTGSGGSPGAGRGGGGGGAARGGGGR